MRPTPRALAAAILALGVLAGSAAAQDAAWRDDVDAILDRWNDEVEGDRVARAIERILAHLTDSFEVDPAARLELARLELARDNCQAAIAAADEAARSFAAAARERREAAARADAGEEEAEEGAAEAPDVVLARLHERRVQALAVANLAARYQLHERVQRIAAERDIERYIAQQREGLDRLLARLRTVAGGEEPAAAAIEIEVARRDFLRSLPRLGEPPHPLGSDAADGAGVDFTRLTGQVVIVLFWSEDLVDTTDVVRQVEEVRRAFADKGVAVVGVNVDEDADAAAAWAEAEGLEWRHVFTGAGWQSQDLLAWGIRRLPGGVLIDADGRVRYVDPWGPDLRLAVEDLVQRRDDIRYRRR